MNKDTIFNWKNILSQLVDKSNCNLNTKNQLLEFIERATQEELDFYNNDTETYLKLYDAKYNQE